MKKSILLILGVASLPLSASAAIVNGDFEGGNDGNFASDYTYDVPAGSQTLYQEGEYTVDTNANNVHNLWSSFGDHTSGEGNYFIANGSDDADFVVWNGFNDPEEQLLTGETYTFSAWVANVYADNPAQLTFVVDGYALNATPVTATGVGVWQQFSFSFEVDGVNIGNSPSFSILNQQTALGGNDFGLDDITVAPYQAVPEPASMIALGLGGMALLRRRRKSA